MEVLSPERLRFHLRAPCANPTLSGCRGCAGPIGKGKSYYCDDPDCKLTFESNHFYRTAANAAVFLSGIPSEVYPEVCEPRDDGYCWTHVGWVPHAPLPRFTGYRCARCLQPTHRPEVNHIRPLNGDRHHFGCQHHLQNLEVLCHQCHLATTAHQRAMRLIGGRS